MAVARGRGRRGRRGSDAVDSHIGQRLRERRRQLGLSQAALAARMGFTAPQINRYEHGTTRLSAAGLWRAGKVLGVPPGYFFAGLGERGRPHETSELEALALKVARHLDRLSPGVRDKLLAFIASLTRG
ncbi:MAG: helix-turn-helix transcriptional regulator [Proteobacteria bacterium]|nr:helix-turn-helix transcriptional regulator [Pseudomonadota bacterium]